LNYNEFLVISRRAVVSSCLALLAGCRRKRGSGFPGYAFVANQEGQAIAAVDLTSFVLARYIPLQASPTAVIADAARKSVYALTPETGTVHEIDPGRLAVRRHLRIARRAVSMRLSPDGGDLWVLASDPRQLSRVSLDSFRSTGQIPLPGDPVDFDISPDGGLAAVSGGAEGIVSVLDLRTGKARKPVHAAEVAGSVRFRPDGKQLLVADTVRRVLAFLEAPSGRIITNLALAIKPEHFCYKADGGELFVSGEGMDAVVIVNPYYTEVTETVLAGRAPAAMAISGSPEYLFVTNPPTGDVTILDVDTRHVIAVVSVGQEPNFVTMTPDDQYALILNRRSGNMAVIRLAAVIRSRTRGAPLFTTIPVGSAPVSAAVLAVE
jgi:YVTN family beta-propeller protein